MGGVRFVQSIAAERSNRMASRGLLLATIAGIWLIVGAAVAHGSVGFGVSEFKAYPSTTQAGAYADARTEIQFNRLANDPEGPPAGILRNLILELPPGLVGDPLAVPRCNPGLFQAQVVSCPSESQVGEGFLYTYDEPTGTTISRPLKVFNLHPPADEPARLGIAIDTTSIGQFNPAVHVVIGLRNAEDHGLLTRSFGIPYAYYTVGLELTLWGVPADHGTGAPRRPFMQNPTTCEGTPVTTLKVDSYQEPGRYRTYTAVAPTPTGCEDVPFEPSISVRPATTAADTPSGYAVEIEVPQNDDPDRLASAHLDRTVIALPEGVAVSPSAADGLGACAPHQIALDTDAPPTCPDASKIGTVEIETPVLEEPLRGSVFLATQTDNPFRSLLAIYLYVKGPGVVLKLPGRVDPDPRTGRLVSTFDDNPQLPFSRLIVTFTDGPRAPLVNPPTCGTYTATAALTPYSAYRGAPDGTADPSSVRRVTSTFAIDRGPDGAPCPGSGTTLPFAPGFEAGGTGVSAGGETDLVLTMTRRDGHQELGGLDLRLPEGLLARLARLPALCEEAAAATGTCGADSRIGTVVSAAGPGPHPFHLPGTVSMTGPYKGAPFGLSIVVPAVAGPFDLGTVVVRARVFVDPVTAALRVVTDPLPRILEGIPLRIRAIHTRVDRRGFMINPTDCSATRVVAAVQSTAGALANVQSRFQVGDCAALAVRPRMTLRVGARGKTRRFAVAPLTVALRQRAEEANLRSVRVTLPRYLASRPEVLNVRVSCTLEQYQAERCPMQVGTATAVTPLLRAPLEGKVYLVRHPDRRLPDMMVRLKGQGDASGVIIDLTGKITIGRGLRLTTRFDAVPDAPVTRFVIRLAGDRNGPIATNRNLCVRTTRRQRAHLGFRGQNGRLVRRRQRLRIDGCARPGARRATSAAGRRTAGRNGTPRRAGR